MTSQPLTLPDTTFFIEKIKTYYVKVLSNDTRLCPHLPESRRHFYLIAVINYCGSMSNPPHLSTWFVHAPYTGLNAICVIRFHQKSKARPYGSLCVCAFVSRHRPFIAFWGPVGCFNLFRDETKVKLFIW